ncbi:hypothetical protein GGF37_007427, partial [Kickxella alabastrina]
AARTFKDPWMWLLCQWFQFDPGKEELTRALTFRNTLIQPSRLNYHARRDPSHSDTTTAVSQ